MIIRCTDNIGAKLLEYGPLPFGIFESSEYGELEIGREYMVMGMVIFDGLLRYITDDGELVGAYPWQLFEILDHMLPVSWYFNSVDLRSSEFPNKEAIWGFYELVFEEKYFEELSELERNAIEVYFKRKKEIISLT